MKLRDARGRFSKPILTWGVELEGGFEGNYEGAANEVGWQVDWDESVDSSAHAAELVSPVYKELTALKTDLKGLYRYVADMNSSMGFHIHIGVPRPVYYLLSSWGFVRFFQDAVADEFPAVRRRLENHFSMKWAGPTLGGAWGPDWPRHHTLQVEAEDKYDGNGNDRYKSVNFCYGLHKTIEFRLFPACDRYNEAFGYLDFVKWSVGEWVSHNSLATLAERVAIPPEDVGEALIDLDQETALPTIPFSEAEFADPTLDVSNYFQEVLGEGAYIATNPGLRAAAEWMIGGRTVAELESRVHYPHGPGCAACDQVRLNNEPRILEVHRPGPGAMLQIATHFNTPDSMGDSMESYAFEDYED